MKRILWLATADARGHLMRCQILTQALRARGVAVDVVTTSEEGREFLAAFAIDAEVVSPHYRVEFDDRQDMSRLRTEWRVFRYFTSPRRFVRDLHWLGERAAGADLLVNDSFHPALLVAEVLAIGRRLPPRVHIYGTHLRRALEDNFKHRLPGPIAGFFAAQMAACTDRAFARIEHSLGAPPAGHERRAQTFVLPPVVALPTLPPREARAARGLAPQARLAVAYLNPHFRDPSIARAVEDAAAARGLQLYGVGEGYPGRPGWRAHDARLADLLAAADLFISAPGLGAMEQARALGVPLLALVTDQPEQVANARAGLTAGQHLIAVACAGRDLRQRLSEAAARLLLAGPRCAPRPQSALPAWIGVFEQLLREVSSRPDTRKVPRWLAA